MSKAKKNDQNKPDLSLIPLEALIAAAQAYKVGEIKYGRYNYENGHEASRLIAGLLRHATAWFNGEENDPIDGQPHLGSVIATAGMILRQQALGTLIDNRSKNRPKIGLYQSDKNKPIRSKNGIQRNRRTKR